MRYRGAKRILLNRSSSSSTGYVNDEAASFVARMTSAPDIDRRTLIDAFFSSLKSIGLSKFDAVYLFAAHDSQASLLNLVSTSYDCTLDSSPTFTANSGWNGVGATGRLNSGFNPSTAGSPKFVQDSANRFGWSLTAAAIDGGLWGGVTTYATRCFPRHSVDSTFIRMNSASDGSATSTDGSGLWAAARGGSTEFIVYRNGAQFGATISQASTAVENSNFVFLFDPDYNAYTGRIACGGFGSTLTSGEQSSLYTALQTYLTGVGAI